MCLTVLCDDGETYPAWEAETYSELEKRMGGQLIRDPRYAKSVDLSGDCCLCAVDIVATAEKFGYVVDSEAIGPDVIFKWPAASA